MRKWKCVCLGGVPFGAQTSRGNKGEQHLAGGSWGVPLGKRRRLQRSPKEEGVRAFKATVPRDTRETISQPELLSPVAICLLMHPEYINTLRSSVSYVLCVSKLLRTPSSSVQMLNSTALLDSSLSMSEQGEKVQCPPT